MDSIQQTSKVCMGCGIDKNLSDFHNQKTGRFGKTSRCKVCYAEHAAKYNANHKKERAIHAKEYRINNRFAHNERQRRYRFNNPERTRDSYNRYNQRRALIKKELLLRDIYENPEKHTALNNARLQKLTQRKLRIKQYAKEWSSRNKQRLLRYARKWRNKNPEYYKLKSHEYYVKSINRRRELARAHYYKRRSDPIKLIQMRISKLDAIHRRKANMIKPDVETVAYIQIIQNDPCAYCGKVPAGTIDHITPIVKGGLHHWDNLTAACETCNKSKNKKDLLQYLVWRL